MRYPLNVKKFCEAWCKETGRYDQDEIEFAEAMVNTINKAYYAGVEDGKRKAGAMICEK